MMSTYLFSNLASSIMTATLASMFVCEFFVYFHSFICLFFLFVSPISFFFFLLDLRKYELIPDRNNKKNFANIFHNAPRDRRGKYIHYKQMLALLSTSLELSLTECKFLKTKIYRRF